MTDLIATYYEFWNTAVTFEDGYLPFFNEQLIPTETPFPYGTFSASRNDAFANGLDIVRIWTKSTNLMQLSELLDRIETAIPNSGVTLFLPESKGALRLFRGLPFIQRQPMPEVERDIQVGYINVETRSYIY